MATALNPIDEDIGCQVRSIREMYGFTLYQVAEALDISPDAVRRLEAGENRFQAAQLNVISKMMNVNVGSFFARLKNSSDGAKVIIRNKPLKINGFSCKLFDYADFTVCRRIVGRK